MSEMYKEFHKELGWIYVPKTIAQILKDVSKIDEVPRKVMILEFHVQSMEEEMRRIETFKHQIPHSIHFLEDATEIIKQEILRWKKSVKRTVAEEFMPLKSRWEGSSGVKESNDVSEKKEWMSSVQLWTSPVEYDQDNILQPKPSFQADQGNDSEGNLKHKGGTCMLFENKAATKNKGIDQVSSSGVESDVKSFDLNIAGENLEPSPRPLQSKKQRRCWSPALHRQFVCALQHLGGINSATPKHIREVMNVEGLTNDEVKSHLQASLPKAFIYGSAVDSLVDLTRKLTSGCGANPVFVGA